MLGRRSRQHQPSETQMDRRTFTRRDQLVGRLPDPVVKKGVAGHAMASYWASRPRTRSACRQTVFQKAQIVSAGHRAAARETRREGSARRARRRMRAVAEPVRARVHGELRSERASLAARTPGRARPRATRARHGVARRGRGPMPLCGPSRIREPSSESLGSVRVAGDASTQFGPAADVTSSADGQADGRLDTVSTYCPPSRWGTPIGPATSSRQRHPPSFFASGRAWHAPCSFTHRRRSSQ